MIGSQPFVYLRPCGCVFSHAGLKAVTKTPPSKSLGAEGESVGDKVADKPSLDLCPQCGAKYDRTLDVLALNPSPEVEQEMRATMEAKRLLEPVKGKGKKRKAVASVGGVEPPTKKQAQTATPTTNPSISAASRAVVQELAKEEVKRKSAMSDAVKSLYSSNDGSKRKETFMTMGTFTRVGGIINNSADVPLTFLYSTRNTYAVSRIDGGAFGRCFVEYVIVSLQVCIVPYVLPFAIISYH